MSIRNLSAITDLPFNVPPIEDVVDQLPRKGTWETYSKAKISHGKYYYKDGSVLDYWDSTKHPIYYPSGFRPDITGEELDMLIVHHTASDAPLVNQANYHVNTHKWPGIAYHVIIDELKIKQTNDLHSMTFHAGGWNTNTIAVCINADLSKREITSRERELLYAAILSVKAAVPTIKTIKGHNELNSTACPCIDMDQVRMDIQTLEQKMVKDNTWNAKLKKWSDFVNEMNYLSERIRLGEHDGDAKWAMYVGLEAYDVFKSKHLL